MSPQSYLRRTWRDTLGSILVIVFAIAAVGFGVWQGVRAIRADAVDDERLRQSAFTGAINRIILDRWQRERDSLRAETGKRDTVLQRVLVAARREATTSVPPAADSVPAVALRACRATLDTTVSACEAFRKTATASQHLADSLHRVDSLRLIFAASVHTADRDTIDHTRAALTRAAKRPGYRGVATGTAIGAGVGVLLCAVFCR